jgi:hypothetical protein
VERAAEGEGAVLLEKAVRGAAVEGAAGDKVAEAEVGEAAGRPCGVTAEKKKQAKRARRTRRDDIASGREDGEDGVVRV